MRSFLDFLYTQLGLAGLRGKRAWKGSTANDRGKDPTTVGTHTYTANERGKDPQCVRPMWKKSNGMAAHVLVRTLATFTVASSAESAPTCFSRLNSNYPLV